MFLPAILLLSAIFAHATFGVDVAYDTTVPFFSCLSNSYNVDWVIVRCYRSIGSVDSNCIPSIQNARKAGIKQIDVYHFPDTSKNPHSQIVETLTHLNETAFDYFWLDIEDFEWKNDPSSNIIFISSMITTLKLSGQEKIGIYTGRYSWPVITGNTHRWSDLPLWYAHYDNNPSFSDYGNSTGQLGTWGGWITPFAKQYEGDVSSHCGSNYDLDWKP